MIDIGKEKITLDCGCGTKVTVTLAQIAKEAIVHCAGCGEQIQLRDDGGGAKRTIAKVKRSLDDLNRAFRRIGK
jgi:hypothetical protein